MYRISLAGATYKSLHAGLGLLYIIPKCVSGDQIVTFEALITTCTTDLPYCSEISERKHRRNIVAEIADLPLGNTSYPDCHINPLILTILVTD